MTGAFPPRKRGRPAKPRAALDSNAARELRPRFGDLSDWERAIFAAFPDSLLSERVAAIADAQHQLWAQLPAKPPTADAPQDGGEL